MHILSDRGTPASLRHIHGFSGHTYKFTKPVGSFSLPSRETPELTAAGRLLQIRQDPPQVQPGHQDAQPARGGQAQRRERQPPHRGPVQRHRARRLPQLDRLRAGHGPQGRREVPLEHLRPDACVAAQGLSAAADREADAERECKSSTSFKNRKDMLTMQPKNYFEDIEQAAFSPSTMVPGIAPSADPSMYSLNTSANGN